METTPLIKSHGISHSVSAANTYRRCPRLYYHTYVEGWEPRFKSSWLDFGTKIDELLEMLDTSNLELAIQAVQDKFADPFQQAEVETILRLWAKQYAQDPLPPYSVNRKPGNQYGFRLNWYGNIISGHVNLTVSGYIDKVTIIAGDVGFMEGKTTKDPIDPKSDYWEKLAIDPQIACYAWALSKELGRPVNHCWYQVVRRPSPAANAAFKRTYERGGVEHTYTLEEYRERLSKLLIKEPKKALIARKRLYITDERKELFITEHAQSHSEILGRKEGQRILEEAGSPGIFAWPRNHFGCPLFGGCSFWDVCTGKTTIEASGKFQKRIKNANH